MRVFRLKRETSVGHFSLDHWQLYIGAVSDLEGNRYMGLSILGAVGELVEFPFKLSEYDAKRMIEAIEQVLRN